MAAFSVAAGLPTSEKKEVHFPSKDGLEITGDLYQIDPHAPYILLCHQAGYSRGEYVVTAERLNKLGYNCLAIDLRSGGAVNGVENETAKKAAAKNLPTEYLDAEQDMLAGVEYLSHLAGQPVILFGSSYSASLALKIASENELVEAVIAFSPGEYFGDKLNVKQAISHLDKPVFVASTKGESDHVRNLVSQVPESKRTQFTPGREGMHGSRALWKTCESQQECWMSLIRFLSKLKNKESSF
ncbi:MAG: dienelactone hydrolase family protein [Flavobacteriales bacterium]|nr:dienelactone hydrolase family protein [Flavobacteriales bacterium]